MLVVVTVTVMVLVVMVLVLVVTVTVVGVVVVLSDKIVMVDEALLVSVRAVVVIDGDIAMLLVVSDSRTEYGSV